MGLYPVAVYYNARQNNAVQYSTVQYNIITHIIHNNIQHSRQLSKSKITKKKNLEHILYTVKTQKRVESKVDESVFKTTTYIKQ